MKSFIHIKSFKYTKIFVVSAFLFIAGCGVWQNFTTFFNRYYNAQLAFEAAEEAIANAKKESLFAFKEEKLPSKAKSELDRVIEKCSKILQFNRDSDYFDEALLMIGKAFYLQNNFTKAIRKFRELEARQESELLLENKVWIAKSEMQMRNFDTGLRILGEVDEEAGEKGEEEILAEVYLALVKYYMYREDYPKAVTNVDKLLEVAESDELIAEVYFELGKLYLLTDNLPKAAESFLAVTDYSPKFETDFQSRLEYVKVQKELGLMEESLEMLEELRDEDKYSDYWDAIELEIADLRYKNDEFEEALNLFTEIDTTYKNTQSAGMAVFRLAEIFEKDFRDYDSSKVLYDRVTKSAATAEYKDGAREKSTLLTKRGSYLDKITTSKRQLLYIDSLDIFKDDSAAYAGYVARKDSNDALVKEMRQLQGKNFNAKEYKFTEEPPFKVKPAMPKIGKDSLITDIVLNEYELANLYFGELEVPDSAYFYYSDVLNNFSDTKYEPRVMYALGSYYLTVGREESADSIFQEIFENHKYDPIVNAAAEKIGEEPINFDTDPAAELFVTAEETILNEDYTTAIDKLWTITKDFPESPFAAKSLYTIGWILEHDMKMLDSAAVVYDTLAAKYRRTEYAASVQSKLDFYKQKQQAYIDSLARLEQARIDSIRADSLKNAMPDSLEAVEVQDSLSVPEHPDQEREDRNDMLPDIADSINALRKEEILDTSKSSAKKK